MKRYGKLEPLRFIIAGAINTGITYVFYLVLLQSMPYVVAYSITYLAGIARGYVLNAYVVFKKQPTARSAAMYPLLYGLNFALGLSLVYAFVELVGVSREIAPLLAISVSVPIMYMATSFVFKG